MRSISSVPSLETLCRQAQTGDVAARDQILKASMGLVVRTAQRFFRAGAFLELGDLIQQGCLGVLQAIHKFDPKRATGPRPIRFTTYAYYWVGHCIRREIENHGLTIAIPVERLNDPKVCLPKAYSVDLVGDVQNPRDTPEQWCRVWEAKHCVDELLKQLSEKQRTLLKHRYGLYPGQKEQSQRQVARNLQISASRVGTLERAAIVKLKREWAYRRQGCER